MNKNSQYLCDTIKIFIIVKCFLSIKVFKMHEHLWLFFTALPPSKISRLSITIQTEIKTNTKRNICIQKHTAAH